MFKKPTSVIVFMILLLGLTNCQSPKKNLQSNSNNQEKNTSSIHLIVSDSKERNDSETALRFFSQNEKVKRFREVDICEQVVSGTILNKETEFLLNLFDDASYESTLINSSLSADKSIVYILNLKEFNNVTLLLSSTNNRVLGNLHIPKTNQFFTIISNPDTGKHFIIEMQASDRDIIESGPVMRAPAYPGLIQYNQPNGSIIEIFLKGDERIKYAETTDGYTILNTENGEYQYATLDEKGNLILSGISVSPNESRTMQELNFLNNTPKNLFFSDKQVEELMKKLN
ncbi:MAG: hypothetical protein KGZ97_08635 [Bacteroidetes bacterium]|nr:hypothetical protein [Bacteroidota bacterium]